LVFDGQYLTSRPGTTVFEQVAIADWRHYNLTGRAILNGRASFAAHRIFLQCSRPSVLGRLLMPDEDSPGRSANGCPDLWNVGGVSAVTRT